MNQDNQVHNNANIPEDEEVPSVAELAQTVRLLQAKLAEQSPQSSLYQPVFISDTTAGNTNEDRHSEFNHEMNSIMEQISANPTGRQTGSNEQGTHDASSSVEQDLEVLAMLKELEKPAEFGEEVSEVTAKAFKSIGEYQPSRETLQIWKKYKTPSNCPTAVVPSVNPEIWSGLPLYAKSNDAKAQTMQHHLMRAQIAQMKVMEIAISKLPRSDIPALLEPLLDAAKSVSNVVQNLNQKRRNNLRPVMKPEYATLCSSRFAPSSMLFGDNLEQSLKNVKASSNLLKSTQPPATNRFHPYRNGTPSNNRFQRLNYQRPSQPSSWNRGGQTYRSTRGNYRGSQSQFRGNRNH